MEEFRCLLRHLHHFRPLQVLLVSIPPPAPIFKPSLSASCMRSATPTPRDLILRPREGSRSYSLSYSTRWDDLVLSFSMKSVFIDLLHEHKVTFCFILYSYVTCECEHILYHASPVAVAMENTGNWISQRNQSIGNVYLEICSTMFCPRYTNPCSEYCKHRFGSERNGGSFMMMFNLLPHV